MRLILLSLTALTLPSLAWAEPDCGNTPVKTAELVHTIETPSQFLAETDVETSLQAGRVEAKASGVQTDGIVQLAQAGVSSDPATDAASSKPAAETAYAALLKTRISRGQGGLNLFDYAGAKADGDLKVITAYTDYLASQNPDEMPEADQIAYWANLYNALTVKVILENYPVTSIRKIKSGAISPGPWKRDAVTVNGEVISLDTIEHKILRKRYANPAMVHYMVNCASIGCPNLSDKLWVGATLDEDRAQAARDFINSPRGVDIQGNFLNVSSIYKWFKEDFGGSKAATLEHFRKFADPELLAALDAGAKISGYDYNWDLNE